jgi:hypothetical protein
MRLYSTPVSGGDFGCQNLPKQSWLLHSSMQAIGPASSPLVDSGCGGRSVREHRVHVVTDALRLAPQRHVRHVTHAVQTPLRVRIERGEERVKVMLCRTYFRDELEGLAQCLIGAEAVDRDLGDLPSRDAVAAPQVVLFESPNLMRRRSEPTARVLFDRTYNLRHPRFDDADIVNRHNLLVGTPIGFAPQGQFLALY